MYGAVNGLRLRAGGGVGGSGRAPQALQTVPFTQAFPESSAGTGRGHGEGAARQAPSWDTVTPSTTLTRLGDAHHGPAAPGTSSPQGSLRWSWERAVSSSRGPSAPSRCPRPLASSAAASPQVTTAKGLGREAAGTQGSASRLPAFLTLAGVGPPSTDHRSQVTGHQTRRNAPSRAQRLRQNSPSRCSAHLPAQAVPGPLADGLGHRPPSQARSVVGGQDAGRARAAAPQPRPLLPAGAQVTVGTLSPLPPRPLPPFPLHLWLPSGILTENGRKNQTSQKP